MKLSWTFAITCANCYQPITEPDLAQGNYLLILLPMLILKHQVCPKSQPNYLKECGWNTNQKINLNLN